MARKIYLGNDWDIHRTGITSEGTPVADGIAVRGLLSLTPNGAAIDPTLEKAGTTASGAFLATVQGYDLTAQLLALWEAAPKNRLTIYERVIVDDEDYSDAVALQVERDRAPTEPEEA